MKTAHLKIRKSMGFFQVVLFLVFILPFVGFAQTVSFAPPVHFSVGNSPRSVTTGDFNGDGNLDLAVPSVYSNDVSILLGNGAGSFGNPTSFGVGLSPVEAVIGDFNKDGSPDLVAVNLFSSNFSILLGDGMGFFGVTDFPLNEGPSSVAVGDFNEDGDLDLAFSHIVVMNQQDISILFGDGSGSFSNPTYFTAGGGSNSIATWDFNGDSYLDLAVANASGTVSILLGTGTGTFGPVTSYPAGVGSDSLTIGDFNMDGRKDLAKSNSSSSNVSVFLGNGNGTFSTALNIAVGVFPRSVDVGDLNGDGKQDLLVVNQISGTVSILLGNGSGSFASPLDFAVGADTVGAALGDFSKDGRPDISVVQLMDHRVSIFLNTTPFAGSGSNITNISTRGFVGTGANVQIGGFIIEGTEPKTVLVRAQGPSLVDFGVSGVLANPTMQLFSGSTMIAQNNNWQNTDPLCLAPAVSCGNSQDIIATGLDPCSAGTTGCTLDSAIYISLPPGAYTAIVSGVGAGTGVGLIGVFDVDSTTGNSKLGNISTRSFVGTGANVQIGGFIVEGTNPKTVLVRAQGPSLVDFGVTGVLANPTMQIFSGSTVIAQNNNWQTTDPLCAAPAISCGNDQDIIATGLDPCTAATTGCTLDSAVHITLPPGAYTAIVSGVNNATGVGLVGVFDVD